VAAPSRTPLDLARNLADGGPVYNCREASTDRRLRSLNQAENPLADVVARETNRCR
jgi:hypothetical protein